MATWTVSGIGSNSTGRFTFPPNTETTDKSYTVTYDDGQGGTGSTSVTVPSCGSSVLPTCNITCEGSLGAGSTEIIATLNSDRTIPSRTIINCTVRVYYNQLSGTKTYTDIDVTINSGTNTGFNKKNVSSAVSIDSYCIKTTGIFSDNEYNYSYATCH